MKELIFDKGTLLLKGLDIKVSEHSPNTLLWDSRVKAYRAPAYRYPQLLTELSDFKDQVGVPQNAPILKAGPNLRPYQEAALSAWRLHENRGIIVLPTGSGKTLVAIGAIALLGVPTLILVPTRVLLEQWEVSLVRYFESPIGVMGDG